MSIDRIGKSAPPTPSPETNGPSETRDPTRTFGSLDPSRAAAARPPAAVEAPHVALPPLERFRSGQVDMQGYLDLKVDEATAHLSSLPRVELDAIRAALRDRLATDPALADLVRTATGKVPEPSDDA
ncbi:MAG: hypothetical protein ACLP1X_16450 [Polyangiaceae bacterium]|jgi:hypothetical protein